MALLRAVILIVLISALFFGCTNPTPIFLPDEEKTTSASLITPTSHIVPTAIIDSRIKINEVKLSDFGLVVWECRIPDVDVEGNFDCFPPYEYEDSNYVRSNSGAGSEPISLWVNNIHYMSKCNNTNAENKCYLIENGRVIYTLSNPPRLSIGPNLFLLAIDDKIAWDFISNPPTFYYDSYDVRERYNLIAAYFPHSINGKLLFLGNQDGKFVIFYDGKKLNLEYDSILRKGEMKCLYSDPCVDVRRGPGQYEFKAIRSNIVYKVMIMAAEFYAQKVDFVHWSK
jgi:hypothetical protein